MWTEEGKKGAQRGKDGGLKREGRGGTIREEGGEEGGMKGAESVRNGLNGANGSNWTFCKLSGVGGRGVCCRDGRGGGKGKRKSLRFVLLSSPRP